MSVTKRTILVGARLFFGLLTLGAIVAQLTVQIRLRFSLVNFFSYFTNLSNILAAVVLLTGAIALLTHREPAATTDTIRGAVVAAMAVVGIVFGALLRDVDLGSLMPWVNVVLHYIMPVVMVADWLILPPRSRLSTRQLAYWLIFPAVYLVYTLVRGARVGFYPYPFLNPAKVNGYGVVALYCVAIAVAFVIVSWLLIVLGNRIPRRALDTPHSDEVRRRPHMQLPHTAE